MHILRIILVEPVIKYINVSKEASVRPLKTPMPRKLDLSIVGFGAFLQAKFKNNILNVSSMNPLQIKHVKNIQEIVFRVKISRRNKKNCDITIGMKERMPNNKAKHIRLKFKVLIQNGKIIPDKIIGKKHKKICK